MTFYAKRTGTDRVDVTSLLATLYFAPRVTLLCHVMPHRWHPLNKRKDGVRGQLCIRCGALRAT